MSCLVFHVSVMLAQTTTENRELRFQKNSQDQTLVISNMRGAIDVESYNGSTIQVEMKKTIKAKNRKDYEHALTEVKVTTEVDGDKIVLKFNPPCNPQEGDNWNVWSNNGKRRYSWNNCVWEPNYDFQIDFKVKVPRDINLKVKTKDEGDVTIKNINGNVTASNHHHSVYIENVNGDIDAHAHHGTVILDQVNGAITAHTHHKDITVNYSQSPKEDGNFDTHHGDINITSNGNIAAKMTYKTRHGDFFTNIDDVKMLPALIKENRDKGKDGKGVSYKVGAKSALQTRNGSILLEFKTYHGDIKVKENS